MERTFEKGRVVFNGFAPALVVVAAAFAMVVIVYGLESIAPGAHDTIHNFRHAIGMGCH